MIQIKRHNLDELANKHCSEIKAKKWFKTAIKQLENKKDVEFVEFWNFIYDKIDILLKGRPDSLLLFIKEYSEIDRPILYEKIKTEKKEVTVPTNAGKLLESIFDYDKFSSETSENPKVYTAYTLVESLEIDTCPYCNRHYIHTLRELRFKNYPIKQGGTNKIKNIVRPDLDHFIPKSTHPFFAISFYNLIPSCSVCNSRFKGDKAFTVESHLYPYSEGFGEKVKFELKVNDLSYFHGRRNKNNSGIGYKEAKIIINTESAEKELKEKVEKNKEVFRLEELYQEHLDYVFELVNKAMIYNDDYIDSLYKQFEGSLFRNREDVLRFVTANYIDDDDLHLRPLSKLTKDIVEQFDL